MMTTEDLKNILKGYTSIQTVVLPATNDASLFWSQFAREFDRMPSDMVRLYESHFAMFTSYDSLELVNKKGRILKRFARWIKQNYEIDLTSKELGIIGDRLQYYVNKQSSIPLYVDLTQKFDWRDGEFGHEGSCYWGCYSDSIPTLENGDAFCIRFYRDTIQHNSNGIGRTWILVKDGMLMCFNSYGVERAKVSKVLKALFHEHDVELHYRTSEFYNRHSSTIPYINSGTGFILYQGETPPEEDSFDLGLRVVSSIRCYHCGEELSDDESYQIDDHTYCTDCRNTLFTECDRCERDFRNDDMFSVNDSHYSSLCHNCYSYLGFRLCDGCDDSFRRTTRTVDNNLDYCGNCLDTHAHECEDCGHWYSEELDNSLCEDCASIPEEPEETEETEETE